MLVGAGALGLIAASRHLDWLALKPAAQPAAFAAASPLIAKTLRTIALWLAIWLTPLAALALWLGPAHVLVAIGAFFAKLAVVTFGGAYAVLAYMAQQAVGMQYWLSPAEMADGLGLAETTPGPLIMVTQFVGFHGAYRAPAPFTPLIAGLLGAAITTSMTFAPCFLWIFAAAPWLERLEHARSLQGALAALTAAVVGVIASLALWFAVQTLYRPDTGIVWDGVVLTTLALALLLRAKLAVPGVLAICGLAGLALAQI